MNSERQVKGKVDDVVEVCRIGNSKAMSRHMNTDIFETAFFLSGSCGRGVTALFTNMRILKFKSQPTIAFFATVNHLNGPLRKQYFTLTGSKGHGL